MASGSEEKAEKKDKKLLFLRDESLYSKKAEVMKH